MASLQLLCTTAMTHRLEAILGLKGLQEECWTMDFTSQLSSRMHIGLLRHVRNVRW